MWRYNGGGFIPGVPTRDLTDAEASQFDKKLLRQRGLYVHVKDRKPKEPVIETQAEELNQWQE